MENSKKQWQTPKLVVHGTVETLTQQGGGNRLDLPIGTVVSDDATISDVTS